MLAAKNDRGGLILASTSPRRRELVALLGLPFQFAAVDVDEAPRANESAEEMVRRLAIAKARSGSSQHPGAIVVAADTIVALDHSILGKPDDAGDAIRMLKRLRARPHIVYTGLVLADGTREHLQIATTTVWMRDYSDAEIAAYVDTGDPLDKAAAYAIQHPAFHPVARIEGCYSNVMGLPLCRLYLALREFGIGVPDPHSILGNLLEANCPVAQEILNLKS
ncbi:MAG: septum formation protein Maf [Chloroflexi bacterium]|nr:septum formation protein Maf [Chloroflexota bacterium]